MNGIVTKTISCVSNIHTMLYDLPLTQQIFISQKLLCLKKVCLYINKKEENFKEHNINLEGIHINGMKIFLN